MDEPRHGNPAPWQQEAPPQQQQQWGQAQPGRPKRSPLKTIGYAVAGVLILGLLIDQFGGSTSDVTAQPVAAAPVADPATTTAATTGNVKPRKRKRPAATTPPPAPKAIVYRSISSRQWRKIAKDPEAHAGEAVILYGYVTQADGNTGKDAVRADTDGARHRGEYGYLDYEVNTVLTARLADFDDLVEDDIFKIKGVVTGKLDYDTTLGGQASVPQVAVDALAVIGSTD